jgi:hypothetical protein
LATAGQCTFLRVSLVGWWREFLAELPEDWERAELRLQFGSPETCDRASLLLGPAQPFRIDPKTLRFAASRDGSAQGPEAVIRLLERLDRARIRGTIELVGSEAAVPTPPCEPDLLTAAWDTAVSGLPPDWSDLYGELELTSTAFVDSASMHCVPLNLRREADSARLRFRCAHTFGYGASQGMVRRCLERCDDAGITGTVRILRVLSDSRPVGTQGPVWLVAGRNF